MNKGRSHSILYLLLTGFALVLGNALTAQAQIEPLLRKDMPAEVRCYIREDYGFSVVLDERKMPFGFVGYNAMEDETQKIFHKLSRYTDLKVKVYTVPIKKSDFVPAAAICPANDGLKYIVYVPEFMQGVYNQTRKLSALLTIIAHEVGHYHFNHHTIASGEAPFLEKQADEYAGEVLGKMSIKENISLDDALSAYRSERIKDFEGAKNYPPIAERIEAFKRGWYKSAPRPGPGYGPESIRFNIVCGNGEIVTSDGFISFPIFITNNTSIGKVRISLNTMESVVKWTRRPSPNIERTPIDIKAGPITIDLSKTNKGSIRVPLPSRSGDYRLTFLGSADGMNVVSNECQIYVQ